MIGSSEEFGQGLAAARAALGRGDRVEAEQLLRDAIGLAEHSAVVESQLVSALNELAALRRDMDEPREAETLFQRALSVLETMTDPDEALLLTTLTGLGGVLAARGETGQAELLLTRALTIGERQLGSDHAELGGLLNDLSRLFLKSAAYATAEPLLFRLYEIKRQSKGDEHPEAATVLASLASVRQALGRHDEAETMWRRVLAVRERTLAPNHFATTTALEHLAESCAARGKVLEALQLLKRATTMRELTLGPSHPSVRIARDRMADLQLQASEDTSAGFVEPSPLAQGVPRVAPQTPRSEKSAVASPPAPRSDKSAVASPPAPRSEKSAVASPPAPRSEASAVAPPPTPRSEASAFVSTPLPRADAVDGQPRPQQTFVLPGSGGALALQEPIAPRTFQAAVLSVHPGLRSIQEELEAEEYHESPSERAANRARAFVAAAATLVRRRRMPVAIIGGAAALILLGTVATRSRASSDVGTPDVAASPTSSDAVPVVPVTRLSDSAVAAPAPTTTASGSAAASVTNPHATTARPVAEPHAPAPRERSLNGDVEPSWSQAPAIAAPAISRLLTNNLDSFARSMKTSTVSVEDLYRAKLAADVPKQKVDLSSTDGSNELVRAQLIGSVPQPKFPEILRDRRIEGEVVVRFVVDARGRPDLSTLTVLRSPHELMTDAVRRVVPDLRFQPARRATIGAPAEPDRVQMAFQFSTSAK